MVKKRNSPIMEILTRATPDQSRDTGLAAVLACLVLAYFWNFLQALPAAIIFLLLTILCPWIYRPVAGLWFGLAHLIGSVVSKIVLSVLFFGLVTPIGWLRRIWGADPLNLKKWKVGDGTVFIVRDSKISPDDLERPY